MPLWLFKHIIEQISKKTQLISFHVLGDPLCLENLGCYIEIAKQNKVKIDIVSSGIFLESKHFALLCSENINQVSFSLDAFYDKSNKSLISHINKEVYFDTLKAFHEYAKHHSPNLYINLRLFGDYDYQILLDKFQDFIIQDSKRRIRLAKNFFLRFHKKFQWHKLQNHIQVLQSQNPYPHSKKQMYSSNHFKKPYCLGAIKQLAILSNGIVVPCCIDANALMTLGDLKIQNLDAILQSTITKNFIHAQYTHTDLPTPCKNCTFRGV